jgi:CRISPR-associated protein Cas5t
MLWLYVQAPFAAFRTFTAGSFRPTATFITPSAAFGLLLNVAGIESRRDDGRSVMTLLDVPEMKKWQCQLAFGAVHPPGSEPGNPELPQVHSVFQQLHNYPVGTSSKDHAPATKDNKYNITPVRREYLSCLRAVIVVKDNDELERRVREGLEGRFNDSRYGLPFLGDNAFMPDVIKPLSAAIPTRWYRRITQASDEGPIDGTTRLTVWIDRADMSKTISHLYAPMEEATSQIPEDAWEAIPPSSVT